MFWRRKPEHLAEIIAMAGLGFDADIEQNMPNDDA